VLNVSVENFEALLRLSEFSIESLLLALEQVDRDGASVVSLHELACSESSRAWHVLACASSRASARPTCRSSLSLSLRETNSVISILSV
jgi:enoyl-[acyl-carrier-protein] reductase (NADH)